jgi:type IX secretion system PorP/SprF family membrane protein
MKKYLFILFVFGVCTQVKAQQKPHYTQYIVNQYIINPAITGIENYIDIKASHRHQWVGLQDAPVTTYFSAHGPIGKTDFRTTATSVQVPDENPRGTNYWEDYTAAAPHHGVGVQFMNDRTGPLNRMAAYVTYAYHMGLSAQTSLSAGFGAGVTNLSLDADKLDFNIPVDPAVYTSGVINKVSPDVNAGLYLYSSSYFVGLSAQQIVPQRIDFSNGAIEKQEGRFVPHIFAHAGYRVGLGDDFNVIPSVMVKYVNPLPTQLELNAKLQYRDLVWAGIGARVKDGFTGLVGMNIANSLSVGYSYDYTSSKLNNYTKGTHEVLIGFIIGNRYGDTCPRNVW